MLIWTCWLFSSVFQFSGNYSLKLLVVNLKILSCLSFSWPLSKWVCFTEAFWTNLSMPLSFSIVTAMFYTSFLLPGCSRLLITRHSHGGYCRKQMQCSFNPPAQVLSPLYFKGIYYEFHRNLCLRRLLFVWAVKLVTKDFQCR